MGVRRAEEHAAQLAENRMFHNAGKDKFGEAAPLVFRSNIHIRHIGGGSIVGNEADKANDLPVFAGQAEEGFGILNGLDGEIQRLSLIHI